MSNWQEDAIRLSSKGWSGREIGEHVGISKSVVNKFLAKYRKIATGDDNGIGVYDSPKREEKTAQKSVKTHLIIADTQCKPGVDMHYMHAIGSYIAEQQPDVIIHIGDHFDFESLSSYDRGKKSFEGRRLINDINAGNEGLDLLMTPIYNLQNQQRAMGVEVYNPRLVFCMGNHEQRFDRVSNDMPELDGFVGTETLNIENWGFEVVPYLKPIDIDGIFYVHYLANPFTGKPYGGTALNQLKTIGRSFVVGHKQTLDVAIRPTIDGKMQIGIINGACYLHDEDYKGHQGNNHFRGITVLHEVNDGFGLPMFVSLDYLMRKY